jgi:hypothetical protein
MPRPHSRLLGPLLGLCLIGAALIVPTTAAAATATCDEGRWPAATQGAPVTWKAGARAGDYIWHNANGWHLRVTHPGTRRVVFSGKIVSDAPLTVTPLSLEAGDVLTLSADKLTLTYRFVNHGRIDGFDFRTACATLLKVKGGMSGAKLPIGRIWIGRAGHHPLSNPFAIGRAG